MSDKTDELIAEVERLDKAATKGPWIPGRADMQSYHGHDGNAFTNIYADDERAGVHLGHQLPLVIGEANGEHKEREEERANAELMAMSRTALPQFSARCREQQRELAEAQKWLSDCRCGVCLQPITDVPCCDVAHALGWDWLRRSGVLVKEYTPMDELKQRNEAMRKELETCKQIERERWERAAKAFGIGPAAKEVQE